MGFLRNLFCFLSRNGFSWSHKKIFLWQILIKTRFEVNYELWEKLTFLGYEVKCISSANTQIFTFKRVLLALFFFLRFLWSYSLLPSPLFLTLFLFFSSSLSHNPASLFFFPKALPNSRKVKVAERCLA